MPRINGKTATGADRGGLSILVRCQAERAEGSHQSADFQRAGLRVVLDAVVALAEERPLRSKSRRHLMEAAAELHDAAGAIRREALQ